MMRSKDPDTVCGTVSNIGREGRNVSCDDVKRAAGYQGGYVYNGLYRKFSDQNAEWENGHTKRLYPWIRFYCLPGRQKGRNLAEFLEKKSDTDGSLCGNAVWRDALRRREVSSCPRRKTGRNRDGAADPKQQITLVIDATHPYAVIVSQKYPQGMQPDGNRVHPSCEKRDGRFLETGDGGCHRSCKRGRSGSFACKKRGRIFAATGSKRASAYQVIPDYQDRVVARVLSTLEAVSECAMLGFSGKNLICMQGPFTGRSEYGDAQAGTGFMDGDKESGKAGGFLGKSCDAAKKAGAKLVVIKRPGGDPKKLRKIKGRKFICNM